MPLQSGRNTPAREGSTLAIPVAANTKIFEGSLVVVDGGYAKPGQEGEGLIAAGRAERYTDNTGGEAGMVDIKVRRGCYQFKNDSVMPVTQAHLLQVCYIVDDETVSSEAEGRSVAGKVIEVENEGVWVEIR